MSLEHLMSDECIVISSYQSAGISIKASWLCTPPLHPQAFTTVACQVFFVTVADAQLVTSELPGLVKVAIGLFGLSCKPASLAYRILLSIPLAETVA